MRKSQNPSISRSAMGEMNSTKNSTPSPVIKLAASPPMYHQREGEQQKPGHGKAVQQKRGKLPAAEHPPDLNGLVRTALRRMVPAAAVHADKAQMLRVQLDKAAHKDPDEINADPNGHPGTPVAPVGNTSQYRLCLYHSTLKTHLQR